MDHAPECAGDEYECEQIGGDVFWVKLGYWHWVVGDEIEEPSGFHLLKLPERVWGVEIECCFCQN